jgi:hypothetical protein
MHPLPCAAKPHIFTSQPPDRCNLLFRVKQ